MNVLLISVQRNLDIIGLKQLHHLLLSKGVNSFLLYLPRFDTADTAALNRLDAFVKEVSPGLVGLSLMAIDFQYAQDLTDHLKAVLPQTPVVWGGIYPTTAPEKCLQYADYVCVGEGEQTLLDMAAAIEQGRPMTAIPNLAYREHGTFKQNPLYPLIEDLDTLPILAQIPPNSFAQVRTEIVPVTSRLLRKHKRWSGGLYKTMTSRGCPYACTYCCNNFLQKLYGRQGVRRRSVAHIMAELQGALREGPPLEYVDFMDDCFLACDLDYLREFCREYKDKIQKPFSAKATPRYLTREKMDLAVDAGLKWANIGLQSGSEFACREIYRRQIPPEDVVESTRLIHEYPVAPVYDVIVDNPFESVADQLDTVERLLAIPRPFGTLIFSLVFYEGTDLYERALRECPERAQEGFSKNYYVRSQGHVNELIEMAGVLHRPLVRRLIARFKSDPDGALTRLAFRAATAYSGIILTPLTYFRLIQRTQNGSFWRTLRVLPLYSGQGIAYYLNSFRLFKRRETAAPSLSGKAVHPKVDDP